MDANELLERFASRGTGFDLNPSMIFPYSVEDNVGLLDQFHASLREIDDAVVSYATEALAGDEYVREAHLKRFAEKGSTVTPKLTALINNVPWSVLSWMADYIQRMENDIKISAMVALEMKQ